VSAVHTSRLTKPEHRDTVLKPPRVLMTGKHKRVRAIVTGGRAVGPRGNQLPHGTPSPYIDTKENRKETRKKEGPIAKSADGGESGKGGFGGGAPLTALSRRLQQRTTFKFSICLKRISEQTWRFKNILESQRGLPREARTKKPLLSFSKPWGKEKVKRSLTDNMMFAHLDR